MTIYILLKSLNVDRSSPVVMTYEKLHDAIESASASSFIITRERNLEWKNHPLDGEKYLLYTKDSDYTWEILVDDL